MVSGKLHIIEEMAMSLSVSDRQALLERLARSLRDQSHQVGGSDLYGAWKGRFPQHFDVDSALREIRQEWQRDHAA